MNLFHRHDWGMWERIQVEYTDHFGDRGGTDTKQARRCGTCGKYQLRRIRG